MGRIFIVDTIKDNEEKDNETEDIVSEDIVSEDIVSEDDNINIYEEIMKLSMSNYIQTKLSKVKNNNEKKLFRREALWFNS